MVIVTKCSLHFLSITVRGGKKRTAFYFSLLPKYSWVILLSVILLEILIPEVSLCTIVPYHTVAVASLSLSLSLFFSVSSQLPQNKEPTEWRVVLLLALLLLKNHSWTNDKFLIYKFHSILSLHRFFLFFSHSLHAHIAKKQCQTTTKQGEERKNFPKSEREKEKTILAHVKSGISSFFLPWKLLLCSTHFALGKKG